MLLSDNVRAPGAHPSAPTSFDDTPSQSDVSELGNGHTAHETPTSWPEIDGYTITGELGRGGMGVVYQAVQQGLGRPVALKMILPGKGVSSEHLTRFRAEAEAVARLQHPNIVQVYDIGESEGLPFFSLEFVAGGSLSSRIGKMPQPALPTAEFLAVVARAMHAAHQCGVVHRDLKPANILLVEGPSARMAEGGKRHWLQTVTPKIADFGLAKRLDLDSRQTKAGDVMGTPSYMAPEQAAGRVEEVGPAADVYALGAILYELLTGRPPYLGVTAMHTVMLVLDARLVPPRRLQPTIPRDLETICLKCLRPEPGSRYASAEALADDLKRFVEGKPIQARRTSLAERSWKWVRRHPALAALTTLTVLALASAAGTFGWQWRQDELDLAARREDGQEALRKGQTYLELRDTTHARMELSGGLARVGAEPRLADLTAALERALRTAEEHSAAEAARQEVRQRQARFFDLKERALFHLAHVTGIDSQTELDAARATVEQALALSVAAEGRSGPPLLRDARLGTPEREAVCGSSYELLLLLAEATRQTVADKRRAGREALAVLDRAAPLGLTTKAYHEWRAEYLTLAFDEAAAEQDRRQAAALAPAGALDFFLLGQKQYHANNPEGALRYFDEALQRDPRHFWARCLSALCLFRLQRFAEAHREFSACLEKRQDMAWLYVLCGAASGELGVRQLAYRPNEAREHFARAAEDFARAEKMPRTPEETYSLHTNRGVLSFRRRDYAEALTDLRQATRLQPGQIVARVNLARVYQELKQYGDARAELDEALRLKPDETLPYRMRGQVALAEGNLAKALADFEAALVREPAGSPARAADYTECGRIRHQQGMFAEAVACYDAALAVQPDLALTHRLRANALLEARSFAEAVRGFDAYLRHGRESAEVYEGRGLAKAKLDQYKEAVEDFTLGLKLAPNSASLRRARGWAYLLSDAPKLALLDFDKAVELEPQRPDGYNGRGFARALLGQVPAALADAEEAARLGSSGPHDLAKTCRIYAYLAFHPPAVSPGRPLPVEQRRQYLDRATALLRAALERVPGDQRRAEFCREVILPDPVLRPLRQTQGYTRLATDFKLPAQ